MRRSSNEKQQHHVSLLTQHLEDLGQRPAPVFLGRHVWTVHVQDGIDMTGRDDDDEKAFGSRPCNSVQTACRCFPNLTSLKVTTAVTESVRAGNELHLPASLVTVKVDALWSTSTMFLRALGRLPQLQHLHLRSKMDRSAADLTPLAAAQSLQSLNIAMTGLNADRNDDDNNSIATQLQALGHVKTMHVYPDLHIEGVLRSLAAIECAPLRWEKIPSAGCFSLARIALLPKLSSLRELCLVGDGYQATLISCLQCMPHLHRLSLNSLKDFDVSKTLLEGLPWTPTVRTLELLGISIASWSFLELPSVRSCLETLALNFNVNKDNPSLSPELMLPLRSFHQLRLYVANARSRQAANAFRATLPPSVQFNVW